MKKEISLLRVMWVACAALFAIALFTHADEKSEALEQCIEDVTGKCGNLYEYAVSLEEENARLNKLYKACKANNDLKGSR